MGGCSSMNAMLWIRGHRADYDGWGIEGWGWDDVRPVFERIERRSGIPGFATNEDGPVHVTRLRDPDPITAKFIEAARAAGVPASDDLSARKRASGLRRSRSGRGDGGTPRARISGEPASGPTSPS